MTLASIILAILLGSPAVGLLLVLLAPEPKRSQKREPLLPPQARLIRDCDPLSTAPCDEIAEEKSESVADGDGDDEGSHPEKDHKEGGHLLGDEQLRRTFHHRIVIAQLTCSVPLPNTHAVIKTWTAVDKVGHRNLRNVRAELWASPAQAKANEKKYSDSDSDPVPNPEPTPDRAQEDLYIILSFPYSPVDAENLPVLARISHVRQSLLSLFRSGGRTLDTRPRYKVVIPGIRAVVPALEASRASASHPGPGSFQPQTQTQTPFSSSSSPSSLSKIAASSSSPSAHPPSRSSDGPVPETVHISNSHHPKAQQRHHQHHKQTEKSFSVPAVHIRPRRSETENPMDDMFSIVDAGLEHAFTDAILPQLRWSLGLNNPIGIFLV